MRNKIGLHIGSNPYITGWGDHIRTLDAADIPAVVMSVAGGGFGDIEACWDNGSTVPHVAVIRCMSHNDVPRYDLDVQSAVEDWLSRYVPTIGNDVKKYHERVITKHGNELDKTKIQWLADFYTALHPALLQRMGWYSHKICVFNFSGGEPEYDDWESILPFLQLAGNNPDKFVIGVHEYSFDENDIFAGFPYFVGRCISHLYDVCDANNIKRPKVAIHEFGWRDKKIAPTTAQAMADIDAAMTMYAREMGGDFIGGGVWTAQPWQDSGIEKEVQKLIAPLTQLTLSKEYEVGVIPAPSKPKIVIVKKPQIAEFSSAQNTLAGNWAYDNYGRTTTHSFDDMKNMLLVGNAESYAVIVDPWRDSQQESIAWCVANGYIWQPLNITPPPSQTFRFTHWPTTDRVITQKWGNNPSYYQQFGLPGHEGVDIRAAHGSPIYAVADGVVGDVNTNPTGHNYGIFVRVNHMQDYQTTYAHLERMVVGVGQTVAGGQLIGYADNTGNSFGSHLHLTLKRIGYTYTDSLGMWPHNITDPTIYLAAFDPTNPVPPPPTAQSVLVLPYLRGIDKVQFDMAYATGTQTTQVRHFPTRWLYVKGERKEYECFFLADHNGVSWIHRAEDTSESASRWYAHYMSKGGAIGAPWVPATMEIGKWYESYKYVQHYNKTLVNGVWYGDCTLANGGNVVDRIRLISAPYTKTYKSGKTLSVITLEWASGGERYDFAAEFGNVAFRDSTREFWFMDGPLLGRTDKLFTKPTCVNLGW